MAPGDRVLYIPPKGDSRPQRWGTIKAILGQSALVIFDDRRWPQGAPISRLHRAPRGAAGLPQFCFDFVRFYD